MKATSDLPPGDTHDKIVAIRALVARMFNLSEEQMSNARRERAVTVPRQIAIYLSKHETDATLTEIGNLFGGKHHSTVMHAIARIAELRRSDSATNLAIEILLKSLHSS